MADRPSYEATKVWPIVTEEVNYTGKRISLNLVDADIKQVFQLFHEISGLNFVLDPGVSGRVTIVLDNVPWDQALDLILRINGLDYVLENNVLRVAPISKLAAEKSARAQFVLEQEKALPLKTILKPISYSKASDIAGLLSSDSYLLSSRGSVTVDERTNTLIIRDIVDRVVEITQMVFDTLSGFEQGADVSTLEGLEVRLQVRAQHDGLDQTHDITADSADYGGGQGQQNAAVHQFSKYVPGVVGAAEEAGRVVPLVRGRDVGRVSRRGAVAVFVDGDQPCTA